MSSINGHIIVNAFSSQPVVTQNNNTDGKSVIITSTIYATEHIRCIVLPANTVEPTASEVYAGTNITNTTDGSSGYNVSSIAPEASIATMSNATTIVYNNLDNGTSYDVYCATQSGILSDKAEVTTAARGFASHPVVTEYEDTDGSVIRITYTTQNNVSVRCGVRGTITSIPPLGEIRDGTHSQGTPPDAILSYSNEQVTIDFPGLTKNVGIEVYCATIPSYDNAFGVVSNKYDYTPSPAGFSSDAVVTEPIHTNFILKYMQFRQIGD